MDYKIIGKNDLQVIGINGKMSTKNNAHWDNVPKFWDDFKQQGFHDKLNHFIPI